MNNKSNLISIRSFILWTKIIQGLINDYLLNLKIKKNKTNVFIKNNIRIYSYFPKGYESIENIIKKITWRWLKIHKKNNLYFIEFFFKNFYNEFFKEFKFFLFKFFINEININNNNPLLFVIKNISINISVFFYKLNYKNIFYFKNNTNYEIGNYVGINILRQLFNFIGNNKYQCIWNCSTGSFLKKIQKKYTKYKKKNLDIWFIFLKTFKLKILKQIKSHIFNENILIIMGLNKQFLKIISFLWKLNIFSLVKYSFFKIKLPYSSLKYKKIKSIKKNLKKKLLKIEKKENTKLNQIKQSYKNYNISLNK